MLELLSVPVGKQIQLIKVIISITIAREAEKMNWLEHTDGENI